MDISKKLQELEQLIETYEEAYDPEEKMDLKQTIKSQIKSLKVEADTLDGSFKESVMTQLNDFEEILTY
jgi:cobalamin biosynthesis Mg chelatase CobN